jgi:hypothetical protein
MLHPRELRKPMLAVAVLALGLAACSSAAPAAQSPAPTGAQQTSAVGTQPAATAGSTQPQTAPPSAPPSVGSIKDMDICALITAEEIEAIVGYGVKAGKKLQVQTETAGCQWDGTSSRGIQFVTLAVYAFNEGAWFPPDANEPDAEMVTGVGDEAYRKEIGLSGTAGDLVVRSGGLILNITLFNDQRKYQALHPQQVKLATLLISRLK